MVALRALLFHGCQAGHGVAQGSEGNGRVVLLQRLVDRHDGRMHWEGGAEGGGGGRGGEGRREL